MNTEEHNLSESQVEEIIYKSPWLLDERYVIPNILGSQDEKGRQINIGYDKNRFIDLLFKDTRDNRPVIVELKKDNLNRDSVAQILEYRSCILLLGDESKCDWEKEFGQNYFYPKMILIGNSIDETTRKSANLAGIDVRLLEKEEGSKQNVSFNSVIAKLDEWNRFRKTGNRTLIERDSWVVDIIDRTNDILTENFESVSTIKSPVKLTGKTGFFEQNFPFLNIPIKLDGENKVGIYEYFDEDIPFDESFVYCDFEVPASDFDKETLNTFEQKGFIIIEPKGDVILKVPRKILDNAEEYENFLISIVEAVKELHSEN